MPSRRPERQKQRRRPPKHPGRRAQFLLRKLRQNPSRPVLPSKLRMPRHLRPSPAMSLTRSRPASKRSRWLRNSKRKRAQRRKRQHRHQSLHPRMPRGRHFCRHLALTLLRFNNQALQPRLPRRTVFHRRFRSPEVARKHPQGLPLHLKLPLQMSLSSTSQTDQTQTLPLRRSP